MPDVLPELRALGTATQPSAGMVDAGAAVRACLGWTGFAQIGLGDMGAMGGLWRVQLGCHDRGAVENRTLNSKLTQDHDALQRSKAAVPEGDRRFGVLQRE